ncbi:MAG: PQQ-binding-like beta-propeller repeat protein [Halobacteriaceae archaeon]
MDWSSYSGSPLLPSRRRLLGVLSGAATIGLAGCGTGGNTDITPPPKACLSDVSLSVSDAQAPDSWPFPAHDSARTGYAPNTPPTELGQRWAVGESDLPTGAAATATERWSDQLIWSETPPVLADGNLYVGTTGGVHALDPASGEHRWTVDVALPEYRAPIYVTESLLVVPGALTPGYFRDRLVGIDREARSVRWEHGYPILGSPVPRLAVGADAIYAVEYSWVVELDPATGEYRDDTRLNLPDNRQIIDHALDGSVLYATSRLSVFALDVSAGSVRWQRRVEGLPDPMGPGTRLLWHVVAGQDRVYAQTTYELPEDTGAGGEDSDGGGPVEEPAVGPNDVLVALDAASGEQLWTYPDAGVSLTARPALADGTLFVGGVRGDDSTETGSGGAAERRGFLAAVDGAEGCARWYVEPFAGETAPVGAITGAGETLFVPTADAEGRAAALLAVDATDGSVRARHEHGDVAATSPAVVADGRAYLTVDPGPESYDGDAEIRAYGAAGG